MKLDLFTRGRRRLRRRRLAVVVTALAAMAIALTPAGSASPPSSGIKQYTVCLAQSATPGTCDTSALPGGSVVSLTLTITNANSSTQSLGSANIDGPVGSWQPVFPINLDPAKGPLPTFVSGNRDVRYRQLRRAPASEPHRCARIVTAEGLIQRRDALYRGKRYVEGSCKAVEQFPRQRQRLRLGPVQRAGVERRQRQLQAVWLYPPNHANKNATITNTAYTPTVGGNVHNVAVEAVAADGVTPLDLNSGTATLSPTSGKFDCGRRVEASAG